MQPNPDKYERSTKGFTMIPNDVIFNRELSLTEFRTYAAMLSYAYAKKTEVRPSQLELSARTGMTCETIRAAQKGLAQRHGLIEPLGKGKRGKAEHYRVRELRHSGVAATLPSGEAATLDAKHSGEAATNKTARHNTKSSNTRNEPGVASDVEMAIEPLIVDGDFCFALDEEHSGQPATFGKRQINDQLLTPDGKLPDAGGLECDLGFVLSEAQSPSYFNCRELEKLIAEHGADYCAFWASWLLRKIAAEYEAGRPVESPAGLYTQAVRGHWEVDPRWPQFDEIKHTDAAWKIKNGITGQASAYELDDSIPF